MMDHPTWEAIKRDTVRRLREARLDFAESDARDLIEGLFDLTPTELIVRGRELLTAEQLVTLNAAISERLGGKPVDRIVGWREFFGRRFNIDNVLSPRGDTEVLMLAALLATDGLKNPYALELGTGSGAVAVTLLAENPELHMVATDISDDALATAAKNAKAHGVSDRLTLIRSNWFEELDDKPFDLILSNPPYIDTRAMTELSDEVSQFDPHLALAGGRDGLTAYQEIIPHAHRSLKPGGWLGVEIGFDQNDSITALFRESGFSDISTLSDPSGHPRVVHGRLTIK